MKHSVFLLFLYILFHFNYSVFIPKTLPNYSSLQSNKNLYFNYFEWNIPVKVVQFLIIKLRMLSVSWSKLHRISYNSVGYEQLHQFKRDSCEPLKLKHGTVLNWCSLLILGHYGVTNHAKYTVTATVRFMFWNLEQVQIKCDIFQLFEWNGSKIHLFWEKKHLQYLWLTTLSSLMVKLYTYISNFVCLNLVTLSHCCRHTDSNSVKFDQWLVIVSSGNITALKYDHQNSFHSWLGMVVIAAGKYPKVRSSTWWRPSMDEY
jgi:hypothetical protein